MSAPLFVGLDVGSSATKCVIIDADTGPGGGKTGGPREIRGHHVLNSGFDYAGAAEEALHHALSLAEGALEDIACCVGTGYGREQLPLADRCVTEITCHARGAREWYPQVHHIIDIGGQDTKVIRLNTEGRMIDYRMNAKCAAGTGTFLESTALKLGLSLNAVDDLAMSSTSEAVVNSYCTVFAGTEVIERIKEGQSREDICMGLFRSIATRVAEMLAVQGETGPLVVPIVAATGGVASHCRALVRALEEVLGTPVSLPPMAQHAGAYGAALLALEGYENERNSTTHAASR